MVSDSVAKDPIVDADAHVVESAHTWDYMEPSEKQYRPVSLETREEAGVKLQFWLIDGKVRGLRFPAFSAAQLEQLAQKTGRRFEDNQESREMGNVDLRLAYMDRNGVDQPCGWWEDQSDHVGHLGSTRPSTLRLGCR